VTISNPCGLGLIAPELCQVYVQQQPEVLDRIVLNLAKPTIVSKPTGVTGAETGLLCLINRWVSENPMLSAAGLVAAYFLMRGK
jgi:hypothetical protein